MTESRGAPIPWPIFPVGHLLSARVVLGTMGLALRGGMQVGPTLTQYFEDKAPPTPPAPRHGRGLLYGAFARAYLGKEDKELSLKSLRDRTFRAENNRDLPDSPLKAQEVGRLAGSVCRAAALDLRVVRSSPTLDIEINLKK